MSTRRTFLGWLAALVATPVPSLTLPSIAPATRGLIFIEYSDGEWTEIAELRGEIPAGTSRPHTVEVPYKDTIEWRRR